MSAGPKVKGAPRSRQRFPELPAKLWEGDTLPVEPATQKTPVVPVLEGVQKSALNAPPSLVPVSAPTSLFGSNPVPSGLKTADGPTEVRLWLLPRDPFSFVAHWSSSNAELVQRATHFGEGTWHILMYLDGHGGTVIAEPTIDPQNSHTIVPVLRPIRTYVAELGFRTLMGQWHSVAVSEPRQTPPDAAVGAASQPLIGRFAGRPPRPSQSRGSVVSTPPESASQTVVRAEAAGSNPTPTTRSAHSSTAEQLAQIVWREFTLGNAGSSGEGLEWRAERQTIPNAFEGPMEEMQIPTDSAPPLEDLPSSDALPGPAARRGFWFEVNAELIVHGRTEPTARVTLGGRTVRLRPDGSFTFRFALPDGDFALPAVAIAAAGDDTRIATLRFTRNTVRKGEVGVHPLVNSLRPPIPDAID